MVLYDTDVRMDDAYCYITSVILIMIAEIGRTRKVARITTDKTMVAL